MAHLSEVFTSYLTFRRPYVSPVTMSRYYGVVGKSLLAFLGDVDVSTVTPADLLRYVEAQLAKPRTPQGVNADIRHIRALGNFMAENEVLPARNPFNRLRLLREVQKPVRYITPAEFAKVLEAEPNPRLQKIYWAGIVTGLRLGDVLSLRFDEIDFNRKLISRVTSKTGRTVVIPLHPALEEILAAEHMRRKVNGGNLSGCVWPRKYSVSRVSHQFTVAARKAGLPEGISFHALRRSLGTYLALAGVSVFSVQRLLGHSDVGLTSKFYVSLESQALYNDVAALPFTTGSVPALCGLPPSGSLAIAAGLNGEDTNPHYPKS